MAKAKGVPTQLANGKPVPGLITTDPNVFDTVRRGSAGADVIAGATKKYFDDKGISYTTVDISVDTDALDVLIKSGFQSAPVVNAGDQWWSGFQPDLIDAYIDKYKS